jgi:hypothetical protein
MLTNPYIYLAISSCQHWQISPVTIRKGNTNRLPITPRAFSLTAGNQKEKHI